MISFNYLVRVLGPEQYALLGFASSFIAFFNMGIEYGFGFSAVQKISLAVKDNQYISRYFWSVIFAKTFIFILCLMLLTIIINTFEPFEKNIMLYYILFFSTMGAVIFPRWYYLAIQKTSSIFQINFVLKAIWLGMIFILVKNANDIIVLALLNSSLQIMIGIFGLIVAINKYGIKYSKPSFNSILEVLKDGKHLFYSRITATIYNNSGAILLGLFYNNTLVGYYVAIDKIRYIIQNMLANISQAIFPILNQYFNKSNKNIKIFATKFLTFSIIILVIILTLIYIYTASVINLILGNDYLVASNIFKVLIFAPLFVWIGTNLGVHIMISLGYNQQFFKISLMSCILHLLLIFPLAKFYAGMGVAITIIITELFISLSQFYFLKVKNII